jgi:predicted nuclease of restriction endonuclease-like (RecB) superfamily
MTKKKPTRRKAAKDQLRELEAVPAVALEASFEEVVGLIRDTQRDTLRAVNTALVTLYLRIGEYISRKLASAEWGDGVIDGLALHIARTQPGLRGFSRQNLFRMRQAYEAYHPHPTLSQLVSELPWTHNLVILGQSKSVEEREFYLRMAAQERWTKRELERQFKAALFERAVLAPPMVSPLVRQTHPAAAEVFRDAYVVDFLDLPPAHSESDLHRGLVGRLKAFLMELGRDFCSVGSEYPIQVGGRDFALDLLFFHRGLNCLVAIELKVDRFEPEHLGKLGFYLEALDRDARKAHENPAIGLLLCASKDAEVVEYALSRSLSPALVAQYETHLPDKRLLRAKLHEFYRLLEVEDLEADRP